MYGQVSIDSSSEVRANRGLTRAWIVTLILAALSTFSFLDRQVLALLVPDLKRSLGVTDFQFGVLSGPAFIVAYNLVLVLASLVVDRWNRTRLIVIGAVLWTTMTILSGFAQSYGQLLVLRGGLALGEALLGPAAISLIGDLFARSERPLPTAVYIAGSVVGSTGSTMLSAVMLQVATRLGPALGGPFTDAWRLTLVGVGVPGLLLAIALLLAGREPPRPAHDPGTPLATHMKAHYPLYSCIFGGYALMSMLSVALTVWGPAYITRHYDVGQIRAGYLLGLVSLAFGVTGTLTLPLAFRRCVRQGRVDALPKIAVAATLVSVLAATIGGLASSLALCLIGFGLVTFCVMGVGVLPTLVIQLYSPSHLRGRVSAALFFTLYLVSVGVTPVLIPLVAHALFDGGAALGKAISVVAVVFGLTAALLFWAAKGPLVQAEAATRGAPGTAPPPPPGAVDGRRA